MYEGNKAKVVSPDGATGQFDILARVLQGDILAAYLFIISLDYALRQAQSGFYLKNSRVEEEKERLSLISTLRTTLP